MVRVDYPAPDFRIREEGGRRLVFDALRKTWLVLTPEEWVRQNFVQYLLQVQQYPATLVALEKEMMLNGMRKRFDILVYDAAHQPWLLVECKAESVALHEQVLEQALRYNMALPVTHLVITNGASTRAWTKRNDTLVEIETLPAWNDVNF